MRAIRVHEYGEPQVLQVEELPDPQPGSGQVVVRVRAAGINPVEVYRRSGRPPYNNAQFPYTPGTDGAGTVEAVGPDAAPWKVGDRVFITASQTGTYAELALCSAKAIYPLPPHVSFEQGAAIGVPYGTAHRALFGKAGARSGEFVFIHGATGGVGVAAVQLALAAGLKVGGSGGGPEGEEFLQSLGVKYTCDHRAPGYLSDALGMTCGAGFNVILEMLANVNLGQDPQVLAPGGRIVVIGNRGTVEVNPRDWMARDATIMGMTLMNVKPLELEVIYTEIAAALRRGDLAPRISHVFPLLEAPQAHEEVMAPGARGKIVLDCQN